MIDWINMKTLIIALSLFTINIAYSSSKRHEAANKVYEKSYQKALAKGLAKKEADEEAMKSVKKHFEHEYSKEVEEQIKRAQKQAIKYMQKVELGTSYRSSKEDLAKTKQIKLNIYNYASVSKTGLVVNGIFDVVHSFDKKTDISKTKSIDKRRIYLKLICNKKSCLQAKVKVWADIQNGQFSPTLENLAKMPNYTYKMSGDTITVSTAHSGINGYRRLEVDFKRRTAQYTIYHLTQDAPLPMPATEVIIEKGVMAFEH